MRLGMHPDGGGFKVTLDEGDRHNFNRSLAEFQVRRRCSAYIGTFASLEELTDLFLKTTLERPGMGMSELTMVFMMTIEQMRLRQGKPPIREDIAAMSRELLPSLNDSGEGRQLVVIPPTPTVQKTCKTRKTRKAE